jgi:hypothetical protein
MRFWPNCSTSELQPTLTNKNEPIATPALQGPPQKAGNQTDTPSLVPVQAPVVGSTSLIQDYLDTPSE